MKNSIDDINSVDLCFWYDEKHPGLQGVNDRTATQYLMAGCSVSISKYWFRLLYDIYWKYGVTDMGITANKNSGRKLSWK